MNIKIEQRGFAGAIFLVSAAIIAYQVLLIQLLSIVQWYHFAYMIISVALLGFGASGSILSLFRKTIVERYYLYAPLFLLLTGILMILSLRTSQTELFAFDSYLIFNSFSQLWKLMGTYLLLFLPFLCGALFIGLSFRLFADSISKLYFFNLTGSAFGGLLAIVLLSLFPVAQSIALLSTVPILSLLFLKKKPRIIILCSLLGMILSLVFFIRPINLYLSEYKGLSRALTLPDTEVIAERSTPYGLMQIVKSPYLRYAPGLSLNYRGDLPVELVLFVNGEWIGAINPIDTPQTTDFYDYSTLALPYHLKRDDSALFLDSGSGELIPYALSQGFNRITAVESNPYLYDFIEEVLAAQAKPSIYDESVKTKKTDSYSYLLTADDKYSMISLPLLDSFGGSSGIYALRENYLFSAEGFQAMWNRLDEQGMITVSCWLDYPSRYPLKTLASLVELLEANGIQNPDEHLIAWRNWSLLTFVLLKTVPDSEELARITSLSEERGFDFLLLPGIQGFDRSRFHQLSDDQLTEISELLLYSDRETVYRDYSFRIEPATLDRPYFFQFLKLSSLPELLQSYGLKELPYLELGYLLVILTLIQIFILTALFIVVPLLFRRWQESGKGWTFSYFSLLGLGYMMIEVVFIQRFIFFLDNPLFSSTVVISTMLLFSGLGSYTSSYLSKLKNSRRQVLIAIALLIVIYNFTITKILESSLNLNLPLRMLLTILLLSPIAFILGFPFPLGIKKLSQLNHQNNILWAWGINGSFSVISTVVATILAVEFGFKFVLLISATCYALASLGDKLLPLGD